MGEVAKFVAKLEKTIPIAHLDAEALRKALAADVAELRRREQKTDWPDSVKAHKEDANYLESTE